MSIHPVYASAIMAGRKTVEFRKRRLAEDISTVWVYATAPVQRVVGRFEIVETVQASPDLLWQKFSRSGCISRNDFDRYFFKREYGVGFRIGSVVELDNPIPLSDVVNSGIPPQSFLYLQDAVFEKLLTNS